MKMLNRLGWIAGALAGGVFILAGAQKALEPGAFAEAIFRFRLLPWQACVVGALWLPWIELFTGLALILKKHYRGALFLALGMTVIFLFALISAMARGLNIDCGCFGGESEPANSSGLWRSVLLDGTLLLLIGFAMWQEARMTRRMRMSDDITEGVLR